jgi:NDP-sugar pyrophosphorylase family protein
MVLKTALIIAGGKGKRFEERTEDLPKPLIPVNEKPILERIIEWLKENGVRRVIIGVAYKKEMVKNYFGDGEEFGVKIDYVEHDENGGTEDAFKSDIEQALERGLIEEENFYAMNADQITDLSLEEFGNAHLKNGSIVTIATVNLRTNFGIIKIDENGRITEFQEKGEVRDKKMNSGFYVFNKRIKDFLVGGNIEENAFRKLIKEEKICGFHHDGIWFTINDKRELNQAEEILKKLEGFDN